MSAFLWLSYIQFVPPGPVPPMTPSALSSSSATITIAMTQ